MTPAPNAARTNRRFRANILCLRALSIIICESSVVPL